MEFLKKVFSKENLKKFFYSFIWLIVVVFVLDIVTKWVVVNHFGTDAVAGHSVFNDIPVINGFLYITVTANNGAAFSLLNNARWFWIIVSVVMSGGLIIYYVLKFKTMTPIIKAIDALIIGVIVLNFKT